MGRKNTLGLRSIHHLALHNLCKIATDGHAAQGQYGSASILTQFDNNKHYNATCDD